MEDGDGLEDTPISWQADALNQTETVAISGHLFEKQKGRWCPAPFPKVLDQRIRALTAHLILGEDVQHKNADGEEEE